MLNDPQARSHYDQQQENPRHQRTAWAQQQYKKNRRPPRESDRHLQYWLNEIYQPICHHVEHILHSLQPHIDDLAADPFDDQLMGGCHMTISWTGKRSINCKARRAFCFNSSPTLGIWGICERKSTVRRNIRTKSPSSKLVL